MNQITRGKARVGKLVAMSVNTATINLAGGHANQTLTPEQLMTNIIFLTGAADAGFNVIFNVAYPNTYVVINGSGQIATLKNAAGATTTVADGAIAMVQNDGTNMVALTGQSGTQATLTGVQTLTNKTLTAPVINAGTGTFTGKVIGDSTAYAADGVIALTDKLAILNGTAATAKMTLADGIEGQIIAIKAINVTNACEITPANLGDGTKIALATQFASVILQFDGTDWQIIGATGTVTVT